MLTATPSINWRQLGGFGLVWLLLFAVEGWALLQGVERGWWRVPTAIFDPVVANWLWLHMLLAGGAMLVGGIAQLLSRPSQRSSFGNRVVSTMTYLLPSLLLPWAVARLLLAIIALPGRWFSSNGPHEDGGPLDDPPEDRDHWFPVKLLAGIVVTLLVLWPFAQQAGLPVRSSLRDALPQDGLRVAVIVLAVLGFGQLVLAVFAGRAPGRRAGRASGSPRFSCFAVADRTGRSADGRCENRHGRSRRTFTGLLASAGGAVLGVASLYGVYHFLTNLERLRAPAARRSRAMPCAYPPPSVCGGHPRIASMKRGPSNS
ncbi:MAG: hypothetical protein R3B90_04945 [Planctomycetaceae bacterium]